MTESKVKTAEELAAEEEKQTAFYLQNAESSRFLLRNPRFIPSKENADQLSKYIMDNKLTWTVPNLESALESVLKTNPESIKLKDAYVAPPPPIRQPEPEAPLPPWGKLRNGKDVAAIPRSEYKAYMASDRRDEFIHDVNRAVKGAN